MKFSIITPCFNSSETLQRVYSSLLNLEGGELEWILIDDGSNDDGKTRTLMEDISSSAPFSVKLKFLERNNFGASSVYEASRIASGDLACILDHDDQLTPDALNVVAAFFEKHDSDDIAGVAGRCVDLQGRLIGKESSEDFFVGNEGDLRFKRRMISETLQFTKPAILEAYFANFQPGYTNGHAWAEISLKYKYIFVASVLRVYDLDLPTSYSNTKNLHVKYPVARAKATQRALECYNDYLLWNPIYSAKLAASSVRHRLHAGVNIFSNAPNRFLSRLFYYLSIPAGCFKYLLNR